MTEKNVTPGEAPKRMLPKKAFIGMLIACLVLAVAIGVGVRWLQQPSQPVDEADTAEISKKIDTSKDFMYSGDYDKAHSAVDEALGEKGLTNEQCFLLLLQKGLTYESAQKDDEAITAYKQAEAFQANQNIAEAVARVAEIKGDKTVAIEYYKKAIARIPTTNYPIAGDVREGYEEAIKALGGQP